MAKPKFDEKELEGITDAECPILCELDRCVITGMAHCAHPRKGGLQSKHLGDPECMRRFNAARRVLAHQEVQRTE